MTKAQTIKAIKNFVKASSTETVSINVFVYDDLKGMIKAKAIAVTKYGNVWEYTFFYDNTYSLSLLQSVDSENFSCDLNMWGKEN